MEGGTKMQQIEKLYEQHKQELYTYLLWLTHDSAMAEDLLQETFVQAISSLEKFRGQSSVRTWLFSIARHLWMKYLRDRKPTELPEEMLLTLSEDTIQQRFSDRQVLQRIEELLLDRDERTRKIVTLRTRGYSYAEIADQMGISENSARVLLFRIRSWLKERLEKEGYL